MYNFCHCNKSFSPFHPTLLLSPLSLSLSITRLFYKLNKTDIWPCTSNRHHPRRLMLQPLSPIHMQAAWPPSTQQLVSSTSALTHDFSAARSMLNGSCNSAARRTRMRTYARALTKRISRQKSRRVRCQIIWYVSDDGVIFVKGHRNLFLLSLCSILT